LSRQINLASVVIRRARQRQRVWGQRLRTALVVGVGLMSCPALAFELTVREVATRLHKAQPGTPLDLRGAELKGLDLSGLDFKRADLSMVDLTGADLTRAGLGGAKLVGARIDRATLIGTDFRGADLRDAQLTMPAVSTTFDIDPRDAPVFAGANLSHARMIVRMQGADFSNAVMRDANLSPHESASLNFKMLRSTLTACDLSGVDFTNANLSGVQFSHANLTGAILTGANLEGADLTHATLDNARLDGARLSLAELNGVDLSKVIGLATAVGLDRAKVDAGQLAHLEAIERAR
jgi:uncharacterized protein YjbI with pentapeptide repeats